MAGLQTVAWNMHKSAAIGTVTDRMPATGIERHVDKVEQRVYVNA